MVPPSSASFSPPAPAPFDFLSIRESSLGAWPRDSRDFDPGLTFDEVEVYLTGLIQAHQVAPDQDHVRKLAKKRHRHTKGNANEPLVTQCSEHRPDPQGPRPEYTRERVDAGRGVDCGGFDLQLLEATRLASLVQYAIETGTNSRAGTPERRSNVQLAESRSPTPTPEFNEHGWVTARSKGKGRAE
ncbi:hypothetical protein FS749_014956 [Ceratobasidium sp. UAMH 11750]|nr:hypothetical protein FS749_014956 [Ceratobasidium sp. UAMH 11750]